MREASPSATNSLRADDRLGKDADARKEVAVMAKDKKKAGDDDNGNGNGNAAALPPASPPTDAAVVAAKRVAVEALAIGVGLYE